MLNRGAASAVPAGAISEALQLHTWTLTIGLAQARKAFWRILERASAQPWDGRWVRLSEPR